ncbi:hypothetical protein D8S78_05325 [Natrialba swarupiae]|nr:hypothetical protein [Natrialba swarupiae]
MTSARRAGSRSSASRSSSAVSPSESPARRGGQSVLTGFAVLIVLLAVAVAGWKVWGALEPDGSAPPVPWADDEPFANPAPERTIREPPIE